MGGAGGYDIGVSSSSAFGAQFGPFSVQNGFKMSAMGWAAVVGVAGVVVFAVVKFFR